MGLINKGDWTNIVLVKSKIAEDFPNSKYEIIEINSEKPLIELKKDIMEKLKGKFNDFEVAMSIASGNGKEHMALISALLSIPVGIRLVVFTQKGVEFVN